MLFLSTEGEELCDPIKEKIYLPRITDASLSFQANQIRTTTPCYQQDHFQFSFNLSCPHQNWKGPGEKNTGIIENLCYLLIAEGVVQYRRGSLIAYMPLKKSQKMDGYYEEICPHITTALLNSYHLPNYQVTLSLHLVITVF